MFEGSAATASVKSWAAFSHCWFSSLRIPLRKCLSPFFAKAVTGKSSRQKVSNSETKMRVSVFILIVSLGGGWDGPCVA